MIAISQLHRLAHQLAETDPCVLDLRQRIHQCVHLNDLERAAKARVKQARIARLEADGHTEIAGTIRATRTWRNDERPKRSLKPLERQLARRMRYVMKVAQARIELNQL